MTVRLGLCHGQPVMAYCCGPGCRRIALTHSPGVPCGADAHSLPDHQYRIADTLIASQDAFRSGDREKLIYVPCIIPPGQEPARPDYLATIDLDPSSATYSQARGRAAWVAGWRACTAAARLHAPDVHTRHGPHVRHQGWSCCRRPPAPSTASAPLHRHHRPHTPPSSPPATHPSH